MSDETRAAIEAREKAARDGTKAAVREEREAVREAKREDRAIERAAKEAAKDATSEAKS